MSLNYYYYITFDSQLRREIKQKHYTESQIRDILKYPQKVRQVLERGLTWKGYRFIWVENPQMIPRGEEKWFEIRLCPIAQIRKYCRGVSGNLSCAFIGGHNIYINLNRWLNGSDLQGIPIDQYRTYVINHEVGHILGRLHPKNGFICRKKENLSPVMQQQSVKLNGCRFNPFPLDYE